VEVLLVVQAALVAWSALVVTRCAMRRLGPRDGVCLGIAYAFSWGVQQMIGSDFHEVAFELPLIALAMAAYLDGRWTSAAAWSLPLLLVKEDMGLTLFVFGLILIRRDRRVGSVLCLIGPIAVALTLFVVIPHFTMSGTLGRVGFGTDQGGGFGVLLTHPWEIPVKLVLPPVKIVTVFMMLLPTVFLAVRSPLVLLVVPTLLWRFASNTPNYWGLEWHYSAVLMPIVFIALVDVLSSPSRRRPSPRIRLLMSGAPRIALALAVLCSALLPLHRLLAPGFWHTPPHVSAADHAVERIPSGVLVAATNRLVPHLVDKATVYPLVGMDVLDGLPRRVDWVIADTTIPDMRAAGGMELLAAIRADGFQQVFAEDGFIVLHRS
jgi:uncharacterized membrane protein